jgi:hypothetical protein
MITIVTDIEITHENTEDNDFICEVVSILKLRSFKA